VKAAIRTFCRVYLDVSKEIDRERIRDRYVGSEVAGNFTQTDGCVGTNSGLFIVLSLCEVL
jgi:hypothetical protein